MAPKRAREEEIKLDEASAVEMEESARLQQAAYDRGVITSTKRILTAGQHHIGLPFKADGKDIVKKSSQRKGRYLLNINAQLSAATAGKLGTLAQLDTRNPVLYIDFPEGRLKFKGTIMFPKTKYMVLRFGNKDALCEDILESMVVFSESYWIGTKEENPDEHPMPLPSTLKTAPEDEATAAGEPSPKAPKTSQKNADASQEPSQRPSQRPSQLRQRTRTRYAESPSDGEEASDGDASSKDDEGGASESENDKAGPAEVYAGKTKQSTLLSFVQSQSQAMEKKTPARRKAAPKKTTMSPDTKPGTSKPAGTKKRSRKIESESSDDAEADDSDSDVQEVDASQAPSRAVLKRTAKATLKKAIANDDSDVDIVEDDDDDDFKL